MKKILGLAGIAVVVIAAIVWLTNRGDAETSSCDSWPSNGDPSSKLSRQQAL